MSAFQRSTPTSRSRAIFTLSNFRRDSIINDWILNNANVKATSYLKGVQNAGTPHGGWENQARIGWYIRWASLRPLKASLKAFFLPQAPLQC